jgi:hypothetical protein
MNKPNEPPERKLCEIKGFNMLFGVKYKNAIVKNAIFR